MFDTSVTDTGLPDLVVMLILHPYTKSVKHGHITVMCTCFTDYVYGCNINITTELGNSVTEVDSLLSQGHVFLEDKLLSYIRRRICILSWRPMSVFAWRKNEDTPPWAGLPHAWQLLKYDLLPQLISGSNILCGWLAVDSKIDHDM